MVSFQIFRDVAVEDLVLELTACGVKDAGGEINCVGSKPHRDYQAMDQMPIPIPDLVLG